MILRPVLRDPLRSPMRLVTQRGAGGGVDSDAAAWAAAVTANGGTYSASTLAAVSTFIKAAKASGYWTKLNRINLFAGDQLAAALVPLKAGGGSATDTNVNFVSGDYSEATGLTGNGTTKYLNTRLIPSVSLTLNDTHLAVYNRASAVSGAAGIAGRASIGGASLGIFAPFSDGTAYSISYQDGGSGLISSPALPAPFGFVVSSRIAATSHVLYRNSAVLASSASTLNNLPAFELYVGARNTAGVADAFCGMPLASYSIGSGLTAADVAAYTTHMEAFQDALGRGVQ